MITDPRGVGHAAGAAGAWRRTPKRLFEPEGPAAPARRGIAEPSASGVGWKCDNCGKFPSPFFRRRS